MQHTTTVPSPLRTLLVVSAILLGGCVERTLTIRTQPDNALVTLNDEQIGQSPVTTSFQWYGDYRVHITKEGYQSLDTHRDLKAPWYDYFPFDFVAQILTPARIQSDYEWTFELEPLEPADRATVIQQALTLENELDQQPQTDSQ